jgi:SAM-dependent methyltransferase
MSQESRTPDRIRHHYEVEKELAARLRASTREARATLFKTLYTELFERVPDHPRLTRPFSAADQAHHLEAQLRLLRPHFPATGPKPVLIEFAPGDGRLAAAAAASCTQVYGVDISDQRAPGDPLPENVRLIVYDGSHLDLPDAGADLVFSFQFLEHLHPDDVDPHFALIRRLLKPGGTYVFDTPHRFSGPHDVSRHFGDTLDCFHFQEWTYRSMRHTLERHGFSVCAVYRRGRPFRHPVFRLANEAAEAVLGLLPSRWRGRLASRLFQSVNLAATRKP